MPGNLRVAAPVDVFPVLTYTRCQETRGLPVLGNQYHDGAREQGLIVDGVNPATSLKAWDLGVRLAPAVLVTVRTFFEAHQGVPFFWDHPVTGTRYQVCFTNQEWSETSGIARADASFKIEEAF
jgi:phage-related protein